MSPASPTKIWQVVFACGYVESSHNSWMTFQLQNGTARASKMDAVQDLAHQLFAAYFEDKNYAACHPLTCCKESRKDASFSYCPRCGASLRPKFDFEDFSEWIRGLHGSIVDGTGTMEAHGDWWMWPSWDEVVSVPLESTVVIRENAEQLFTQALSPEFLAQFNEREIPIDEHWKFWYMANMAHDPDDYKSEWPDNPPMDYVVQHQQRFLKSELEGDSDGG